MTEDKPQRTASGTFQKGQSGNPQGRPRADLAALRTSLRDDAGEVLQTVIKAALGGDIAAAKLILDRVMPPLKPISACVQLALPPGASPLAIGQEILKATAGGAVSPDVCATLISSLASLCRIEEVENLRERISALEHSLKLTESQL